MTDNLTLPQLLNSMLGTGIYDISFVVNELSRYGFVYDEDTDMLWFGPTCAYLGARSAEVAAAEDNDTAIDTTRPGKVVDATQITQAILRLIAPGASIPSTKYRRAKGFRKDIALIASRWRVN